MTIIVFSALLIIFSFCAGLLGALTGLGGGIIIIPILVLFFHVNIHYAMGASLISVIATSSGAAAAYLREGYTNLRIGIFLETATVIGAFTGALLITLVPTTFLSILFSFLLFFSGYLTFKRREEHEKHQSSHPWAVALKLDSSYPTKNSLLNYHVQNVPFGLFIMGMAGLISGLLGVGGGALKVLAMDQALRLPYKVATTTSNFMIGITAAVSAGIYFAHGYINPTLTFPVMIGVILGAYLGAKLLFIIETRILRVVFSFVIYLIGVQMLYKGIIGEI